MAAEHSITDKPNPTASTAVTTPPTPAPSPSPEPLMSGLESYDRVLVFFVLVFAFLVASFAAYNNDFFMQAGVGKLLAQGRYKFGEDPFTSTTTNVYWANHSWLFGLIVHAVYDSFAGAGTDDNSTGGTILVVAKALLVAWLAWLMIAAGRKKDQSLWIPAASCALAVLVMSPRLLLN